MEAMIQKLLDSFTALRERASVNALFGEPVTVEGRTIIPVAKIAYGFGMGAGTAPVLSSTGEQEETDEESPSQPANEGSGGGGGMMGQPLAVVEVTEEAVRVQPIIDEQKVALAGTLLAAWIVGWLAYALMRIFSPRRTA